MAGTQQAQQGAMNQLAKDPQAVQTGALAQQQELEAQQRYLQSQQFQPQAGAQSIEDFQSEAIEKAQENVNAQAQQFNQALASFGSLGSRVGNAVIEEMAQGGEVADKFSRDAALLDETVQSVAADNADLEDVKDAITFVLDKIESGDVSEAVDHLKDKAGLFKIEGEDTSAQLTQILEALKIDPKSQQDMISSAIVDGIINPDEMTLGYLLDKDFLDESELGMSITELNDEFGPNWRDMTVSQITEAIEKLYDKQTKDKARILKQLQDPSTDASIKRELRRELQLLDASGVTSAYEAAGRSVKRAQQIDKIAIGGELKNIDEVLDDENIKNKTDELLRQLQDNPDKVQSILAEWKEDNPGYEDMGDWILEQQQEVIVKGETVTDSSDLLKKRDEEATKTVEENQLFEGQDVEGLTEAHIAVLEEVGLVTEGFGKFGNEEFMKNDPTYKALVLAQADNAEKFLRFMNVLTIGIGDFKFEKKHLEGLGGIETRQEQTEEEIENLQTELEALSEDDPKRIELEEQLAAAEQRLLNNFEVIYDTLSDPIKAEKFAHIAQINEALAGINFEGSEDADYDVLIGRAFGDDHELQGASKASIQNYLDGIANFIVSNEDRQFYNDLLELKETDPDSFDERIRIAKNSKGGIYYELTEEGERFEKIKVDLENEELFGFDEEELENIRNLQAIFDADGDGIIDSPETIKTTLMGGEDGMFADGINLKDIGSDAYNNLNSLFSGSNENYDVLIQNQITEAAEAWDKKYQEPADKAATDNQKVDEEEPWVVNNFDLHQNPELINHINQYSPRQSESAIRGHTKTLIAIMENPDIFDSMPLPRRLGEGTSTAYSTKVFNDWFIENITGQPISKENESAEPWLISIAKAAGVQILTDEDPLLHRQKQYEPYYKYRDRPMSEIKVIYTDLSGNRITLGSAKSKILEKIKEVYGTIATNIKDKRETYIENNNIIEKAEAGNPYSDLLGEGE